MLLWKGEWFGLWIVEMGSSVVSLALDGSFHCASAERLAGISVVTVGLGLLAAVGLLGGLLPVWEKCFSVAS